MGRLFWKFFGFCVLAQIITILGVSAAISWRNHVRAAELEERALGRHGSPHVDAAAATLANGGGPALRMLLDAWERQGTPPVYAVDETGGELLGRDVPAALVAGARRAIEEGVRQGGVRQVDAFDGHTYLLFTSREAARPGGTSRPFGREHLVPFEPVVGGLIASFAFAAFLAWYVSKPIRSLRAAFDDAANGNLDVRLGAMMGRRRDELADLGRDFDRTSARLKALIDGQQRLLHDVSHELRSPLARLQAAVGLARQQPEKLETWIERIERESVRMDRLVDELLTLSRVEAGVLGEGTERISVGDLVREVIEDSSFESGADGSKVTFRVDIADLAGATVIGRAELLHSAVENVVRNAMKHTTAQGVVQVVGRVEANGRELRIAVLDEGPGVPDAELESIFRPFFRGAMAKGTDGHGVGLAIARSVVEVHGGTIRAANRAGNGLCVEIVLPMGPALRTD